MAVRVRVRVRALLVLSTVVAVLGAVPAGGYASVTDTAPADARAVAADVHGPDPARYTPPFRVRFPLAGRFGFGDTFGAIREGGIRLHQGVDIGAPRSTPVLAVADGTVTRVGVRPKAGLFVEIRHKGGWKSAYLHLNDEVSPPSNPPCVPNPGATAEKPPTTVSSTTTVPPAPTTTAAPAPPTTTAAPAPTTTTAVPAPTTTVPPASTDTTMSDADDGNTTSATTAPTTTVPAPPTTVAPTPTTTTTAPPPQPTTTTTAAPAAPAPSGGATTCGPAAAAKEQEPAGGGTPSNVYVGATVKAGQVIGWVGSTGNAGTNNHLHFEIRMPDGTPVNPYPLLTGRRTPTTLYVLPRITDEPVVSGVDVVGHVNPGDGFNAGVAVHDGVAYLGTYGTKKACPATGVRRYDVSDPEKPVELGSISDDYRGTRTGTIWVGSVLTPGFAGTLAIVAHSVCNPSDDGAFRGLALYDVTDPEEPVALGTYETGPGTSGVSGFDVLAADGRLIIVAASPNAYLDGDDGRGDVRVVDATVPTAPTEIADWDFRRDVPMTIRHAVLSGADPSEFRAVGVTVDPAGRAFIANWDAGAVIIDLSDPSDPAYVGRDGSLGYGDGDVAATAYDPVTGFLVVGHDDRDPFADEGDVSGWDGNVVFDASGDGDPTLVSAYAVEEATADANGRIHLSGIYAPRDSVIADGRLYTAWISGGVRIAALSDRETPGEVASFVPPTKVDPQRQMKAPDGNIGMPLAWSVAVEGDLVFVSDLNTGLWILRMATPPENVE